MRCIIYAFMTVSYLMVNYLVDSQVVENGTIFVPTNESISPHLYEIVLEGLNATEVWDPALENEGVNGTNVTLVINLAFLGLGALLGEQNEVIVDVTGPDGLIEIPIDLLELGNSAQVFLDLSFVDVPVTFTLIRGKGPVHIEGLLIL